MNSTVNRTVGGHFEEELCELLAENGWWAHNMAQNQVGQPADVIAVKDNIAVLIDCKVCLNNRFPLSRVECNQEGAMTLWETRGNAYCYFAMKLADGEIYMVHYDDLCLRELHGEGTITANEFAGYPTFEDWLVQMEEKGCS
jgi:Holliday junction resolvase